MHVPVKDHPSVQRLKRVARALGDLSSDIVFIGGAIAPLLQLDPPFGEARPTKDVDGVIASTVYADLGPICDALRKKGFIQSADDAAHVHRWRSPSGDALDLVPAGSHLGGSGQRWDWFALESKVVQDLGDGVQVRHADAPTFLALKWAAFRDRGRDDPFGSHDLEDILALVASRPAMPLELEEAPMELRSFVRGATVEFLQQVRLDDLLAGHLNNAQDPLAASKSVLGRLHEIATG